MMKDLKYIQENYLNLILEINHHIADLTSEDLICQQFLQRLSANFYIDKGIIFLKTYQENYFFYTSGFGTTQDKEENLKFHIYDEGFSILYNLKTKIIFNEITQEDRNIFTFLKNSKKACLCPIKYKNNVIGFIFLSRNLELDFDEAEINTLENCLEYLSITLNQQILLTKNQIAQAKLTEAFENLKSFDNLKNSFLFNITHEFRSPLVTINGYSELLKDGDFGELTSMQRKAVMTIHKNADHLAHLIDNLLIFVKLSDKIIKLDMKTINLVELVKETISKFEENKTPIILSTEDSEIPIKANSELIKVVLEQLINNAIKFNKENKPIMISLEKTEKSIKCLIIDQGIGMDENKKTRIFDSFVQISSMMNRKFSGLGFGLSLVNKILEIHHFHLIFKSKPNEGTTIGFETYF